MAACVVGAQTDASRSLDLSDWGWGDQGQGAEEATAAPATPEQAAEATPEPAADAAETAADGAEHQSVDLNDFDFGADAETDSAQAGATATSAAAGTAAAPSPATEGQSLDLSGWDFGGGADTAPAPKAEAPKAEAPKPAPATEPKRPRPGETSVPDFEAEPEAVLAVFPDMPHFKVIPSQKDADMFPCRSCHEWAESDPAPRFLQEPHNNFVLQHGLHGKGQFWCFTCHDLEGDGGLKTLEGEKVGFDQAYLICTQCHVQEARDWAFGAHGKRIDGWQGERESLICTACHYQHRPGLAPRAPMPGPAVRQGLERPAHWRPKRERGPLAYESVPPWEKTHPSEGAHP